MKKLLIIAIIILSVVGLAVWRIDHCNKYYCGEELKQRNAAQAAFEGRFGE